MAAVKHWVVVLPPQALALFLRELDCGLSRAGRTPGRPGSDSEQSLLSLQLATLLLTSDWAVGPELRLPAEPRWRWSPLP